MYSLFARLSLVFIIVSACAQGVYADTADDFLSKLEKAINAATPTTQTGSTSTGSTTTVTQNPVTTSTGSTSTVTTTPATTTTPKPPQGSTGSTTPVTTTTPKPAQTSTGSTTTVTPKPGTGNTATPVTRRETLATTAEIPRQTGSTGLSLNSASGAPICNLPEVQSVVVREFPDKSTIRWASVLGAAGYDVLKRTTSGDFILVERVKDPVYTLYLAAGDIKYDHFKIAAVCPESGTTSPKTSIVTKVRTGPELLLLGMFASLLGAGILFMRRKRVS